MNTKDPRMQDCIEQVNLILSGSYGSAIRSESDCYRTVIKIRLNQLPEGNLSTMHFALLNCGFTQSESNLIADSEEVWYRPTQWQSEYTKNLSIQDVEVL